jgi:hypothetical protein
MKSLIVRMKDFFAESLHTGSGVLSPKKPTDMNVYKLRSLRVLLLPIMLAGLIGQACSTGGDLPPLHTQTPSNNNGVNLPPTSAPPIITPNEEVAQGPCAFNASGSTISGWYWLRDDPYAASGQWDCRGLPTGQDLKVGLATLVTNKANGGSGYNSPVKITYSNPTSEISQTIQVYLQNQLAEQSPGNSQGAGYPTTGYFVIPKAYIDTNGGLVVKLERFKPNTCHVAVNAESLSFVGLRHADSFNQSKGQLITGWYWLRDSAYQAYGQWNFKGLDPAAPAILVFDQLVTDQTSGGSGYSMPIEITLINPSDNSQKTLRHVIAQNLLFSRGSNSNGAGYQTYGSIALDNHFIDSQGNLTVRVARLQDATSHLAVNENSVAIIQPEVTQALATPLPSPTTDINLNGLDHPASGKYLFIQYWNNVTGTGTLPALAIDFPDYRFDPATGALSSFNPNLSISLAPTALGFIGQGFSLSEAAGTGAVSHLDTIDQLPYSIEVQMFTGSINLQGGPNMEETKPVVLSVLSIAEDGTISIRLGDQTITLAPGKSWTKTMQANVNQGKYKGNLTMTTTLTNFGWQDRAMINVTK